MDGLADGASDGCWGNGSTSVNMNTVREIQKALQSTLDPRTSNDSRLEALRYLDNFKRDPEAPQHGFTLAGERSQGDTSRYYGLQILEHTLRYRWAECSQAQTEQLREYVTTLAGRVRGQEQSHIYNKIAQLWVELSKRAWGQEWSEMDTLLVSIWEKALSEENMAAISMVLYIVETLSEDIINNEDAVAGLRSEVLGNALNDIMIPASLYADFDISRNERSQLRSPGQGWLGRICDFFRQAMMQLRLSDDEKLIQSAAKALRALRPALVWVSLKAAVEVDAVNVLFSPFHAENIQLQISATEALYSLLKRKHGQNSYPSWHTLFQQALHPEHTQLLRKAFEQSQTPPGEDDGKYSLHKKLAELFSIFADAVAENAEDLFSILDVHAFFGLLITTVESKSLVVSIPILHSWKKLMRSTHVGVSHQVFQLLATVLQICSTRLLRYEALANNGEADDEIVQYLDEDFDTIPERHAFVGNYRRYCFEIVQKIAQERPLEALTHVLDQMRRLLEAGPYAVNSGLDPSNYSRTRLPTLQFDAHYQVVANALKGYSSWQHDVASRISEGQVDAQVEEQRQALEDVLQQWSSGMMHVQIDDPEVAGQFLRILVTILHLEYPTSQSVLEVVRHLLVFRLHPDSAHTVYSESAKVFDNVRIGELQRIAMSFPDELLKVYRDILGETDVLEQRYESDPRLLWGIRAFLFEIVHRAANVNAETRMMEMQRMLKPVYDAWTDPALDASLANMHTFCETLGLGNLADFYETHHFAEVSDWAALPLDQAGQERQAIIRAKSDDIPLRMTKSMLAASIEKVKPSSEARDLARQLWIDVIPVILPKLLRMLRFAQAFHNMANWAHLPEKIQMVVKRTLQDRFWQSGISNESKDEFYARISGSKMSYEGFASVVRGTMRQIRDHVYHILYLMMSFEEQFYGLPHFATSLSEALFTDCNSLSASHLQAIVSLTAELVRSCPHHHRSQFLPPLLSQFFTKLDTKISTEWDAIVHANAQNTDDEELSEEMRKESVLRHLTYSMVTFVVQLLEVDTPPPRRQESNGDAPATPTLRDVVLFDPNILGPLILFCTHALRMRDTRCCTAICKVFGNIIPLFQSSETTAVQVREYVCNDVLKACISSLNEGYFVDMHKDLATLIAQIILLYGEVSDTPQKVMLSLPNETSAKVGGFFARIRNARSEKQQRSLVLELLEGVRGVGIHEQGRIKKEARQVVPQRYMEVEEKHGLRNGDLTELDGVSGLFGGG